MHSSYEPSKIVIYKKSLSKLAKTSEAFELECYHWFHGFGSRLSGNFESNYSLTKLCSFTVSSTHPLTEPGTRLTVSFRLLSRSRGFAFHKTKEEKLKKKRKTHSDCQCETLKLLSFDQRMHVKYTERGQKSIQIDTWLFESQDVSKINFIIDSRCLFSVHLGRTRKKKKKKPQIFNHERAE